MHVYAAVASRIDIVQRVANRLHSLGKQAEAVVWGDDSRGALREKPELMSLANHN